MSVWAQRAMFEAPWWAMFINPYFLPRRALFRAMREAGGAMEGQILDVGCGSQPYRRLLTGAVRVTGLELDTQENRTRKRADTFYDGVTIPFQNAEFDGVLCNQVLEHVFNPERFLAEICRVLAPGGILVLSVPFFWPEHEQPWDCLRYSSFGLTDRLNGAGFEIISSRKLVGGGAALCALAADQLNTWIRFTPLLIRLTVRGALIAPITMIGSILNVVSGPNPDLYLDNFVVARKRSVSETDHDFQ